MLNEWKAFLMRGNILDLAIGVIIGGAFGKIITSFVNDILMPPLGLLLGKMNFSDLFISLNGQVYPSLAAAKAAGAPTLNYGLFINSLIDFILIATAVFFLIKQINRFQKATPEVADTQVCPFCSSKIPLTATRCPQCTSQLTDKNAR